MGGEKRRKKRRGQSTKQRKKLEEPNMSNIEQQEGEIDFEKLVKTEYLKLQREYRLMEDSRHRLAGAGKALSKQARLVELLRNESENLETDLYNADSRTWHAVDRESVVTILAILELLERALADSAYCHKNMTEMVSHVDRITKHLVDHKLKVQAIYGRSMTVPHAERRKRILENRLYLATTRLDTKLWSNKGLREEINMMLKLRALFYQRHLAMKRQLARIRNKMTEVVFTATQAYEQRDELVASIHNIRDKNDKDTRQHVLEIKEFYRILNNDAKAREFNTLKNKERQMLESAKQRDVRRNLARRDEMDNTLLAYSSSFKQILAISSEGSLESLTKHYNELQQENFARFVAISDVNEEVTLLKDENQEMASEIEEMFDRWKEGQVAEAASLEDAQHAVEKKGDDLAQLTRQLQIGEQQMTEMLELLQVLFDYIGCSPNAIMRLLGAEEKLTPSRAMFTMQAVELRGRELVLNRQALELQKVVEVEGVSVARATTGKQPTKTAACGGPFVPDILVAGRIEGEDEDEEEDRGSRVLSAPEYRLKISEKMQVQRELAGRPSALPTDRESFMSSTGSVFVPN